MEIYTFLLQLLAVLSVAALVAFFFEKIKLAPLLGYLIAGVLLGPHGLNLISHSADVHALAEMGVFFLMLMIGLEFSFDRLKGIRALVLVGGFLQIVISIALSMLFALLMGWSLYQGFFLGSVLALSSTAIVLKHLSDQDQLDAPYGRIALGILLFQDFAFVPLMILLNSFGGKPENLTLDLLTVILKALGFVGGVYLFSRFILPAFIKKIVRTQNREILFLITVIFCLAVACFAHGFGLSLAIGAFFAGLMLANSGLGYQFFGEMLPFRHIFVSVFFVSIGLLFDISFLLKEASLIFSIVLLVLLVNFLVMSLLIMAFGFTARVALSAGLILSQIGEFSFILIETARASGGIGDFFYQMLLSTVFITMFLTPFLFKALPAIAFLSRRYSLLERPLGEKSKPTEPSYEKKLKNHIIICGFGPTGRDIALMLKSFHFDFVVVDLNAAHVSAARKAGCHAVYGDVTNSGVLDHAGIHTARAVVISFPDPVGITTTVKTIESLNPDVLLVVRTRYQKEMPKLYELGADVVVMDEWEASLEVQRLLMKQLEIPDEDAEKMIETVRIRKEFAIEEAILRKHK